MATTEQVTANRLNAQQSTGPITEEGAARSSQNSLRHGFTGRSLVLQPGEHAAYQAHVDEYMRDRGPVNYAQTQLVQQLADLDWSVHQMFTEQCNVIALMNDLHVKMKELGDPAAAAAAIAPLGRTLINLSTYENRRRKAAKEVEAQLVARQKADDDRLKKDLGNASMMYKSYKAKGKPFDPQEFGFVCTLEDLEAYIAGDEIRKEQRPTPSARTTEEAMADFVRQMNEAEAMCNASIASYRK
jgi:hypothetical protein